MKNPQESEIMKTAVILSARKERDTNIPYPLQPFGGGQCLLDRTLGILRDNGIEKIVLVVGYRSDLFQVYCEQGVTIVVNNDYQFTASMASLAMAAPYIDEDFLLVESDTFYERIVVEQLVASPHRNCLSVTDESGNGDEAFVDVCNGCVCKITKDRHQICNIEGEMIGLSKISLDTYRVMLAKFTGASNRYVNYEYLFVDSTDAVERPYIKFNNLIWGGVDNIRDFEKLKNYIYPRLCRKENPYDKENLMAYLRKIFPKDEVSLSWQIEQIGGMSNKNFKVVTPTGKSYILRVPGIASEGMVVRCNEDVNGKLACKMGINPTIKYFDDSSGLKLADYIEGAETLNAGTIQRMSNMQKVVDIFRTLHHSQVRFANEFNIFHELMKYERLLQEAGGEMYDGYRELRQRLFALEDVLNGLGVDIKPCHNDLVPENFIKDRNGRIYLIDWEYSGMNDPMADFAALFLESCFDEDNIDFVLTRYFDGAIPAHAREKVLIYQVLWDVLWSIWTCIKEAKGDDFGTYGEDRFKRALKMIERIGHA